MNLGTLNTGRLAFGLPLRCRPGLRSVVPCILARTLGGVAQEGVRPSSAVLNTRPLPRLRASRAGYPCPTLNRSVASGAALGGDHRAPAFNYRGGKSHRNGPGSQQTFVYKKPFQSIFEIQLIEGPR